MYIYNVCIYHDLLIKHSHTCRRSRARRAGKRGSTCHSGWRRWTGPRTPLRSTSAPSDKRARTRRS
ncbi:hypothetical protein QJS04_geneDACA009817 [Acorus gramineus]|uniref:Uncharacterized protein n=1 Tax=Acorus gramineus TaxID=55184 RepID=A0AAV9BAC8_ACOGR|nr:hypothetical protein QJS04_geneDACA009817 [Acorus gramineus]